MPSIVRRDPFGSLLGIPRFFEDFENFGANRGLKINETENDIVVEAVVAGVPAQNVEVDIEDGVLTIKAELVEEQKDKSEETSLRYRYYYSTALSGGAWDKAEADVEHGIVKIRIPKAESARPRKIPVKAKGK